MHQVYISIISHRQEQLVIENFSGFPKQLGDFSVKLSIMDNTGSEALQRFCEEEALFYYHDGIARGFGHNHNKMFQLLNPQKGDIFIICNPDIYLQPDQLHGLLKNFVATDTDIGAPRSYLDKKTGFLDYPDRYFPCLSNFLISIATGKRLHYGPNEEREDPQWLSGSFILFKPEVFKALGGFDEGYFMYCEDIDLCYRAQQKGYSLRLDTEYYIEHNSQMASRKLFSKSILWHMQSAFRFSYKSGRLFCLTVAKG
ncbi:MAG: hypothetical protein DSZ05_05785 [Sulfurospirillum sp.]|nr:MAG: hypothetical protein DSZ05_05785 [Sulfurospirillum sp.]